MKPTQRWIIRSIIGLSSASLFMAFVLFFPLLFLSGQYLAQIHISPEAASLIYNSTSTTPAAAYDINLLYYCEYSGLTTPDSAQLLSQFYPTPPSLFQSMLNYISLSPPTSPKPSKCHWASPTSQLFEILQSFGIPHGSNIDAIKDSLPTDLLVHYLQVAKFSKSLPILLLTFCVFQAYMVWVNILKIQRRPITVYTLNSSYHARHLEDTLVFSCVASLLLMILIQTLDTTRDQHLLHLISDFYSSEDAPIYVFPKSQGLTKLLTWMTEISILLIPLSLVSKFP